MKRLLLILLLLIISTVALTIDSQVLAVNVKQVRETYWKNRPLAGCSQSATFLARTSGLSNTQKTAYQNLICGMVTDGTWSLMDNLYVFATNTTTTANLNLVSTNYTLTQHGTVTFTAGQGYTGNGTNGYFDSGNNPASSGGNFTQNSASLGSCQLNSRTTSNNSISLGFSVGSVYSFIQPWVNASGGDFNINAGSFPQYLAANVQGSWIVSRLSSTTFTVYYNGASVLTPSTTTSSVPSSNMFIGNWSASGVPGTGDYSTDQLGYVFWGGGFTGAQVGNIYARLHTYMSAVGAGAC